MIDNKIKNKKKAIIYGLGNCWKQYAERLLNDFDIVYCSDQNDRQAENRKGIEYIIPSDISTKEYDILILCNYSFGMREELILQYEFKPEKLVYCLELYGRAETSPGEKLADNINDLTIIIPTYNRKQRLEKTLNLLNIQTNQNFKVIILDDKSDYDVDEIVSKYECGFASRIRTEKNIGNLGLASNTAMAFTKVEEGWIWTLADDDIPSIYAVELVHQEIENSTEVGIILFSIQDMGKYLDEAYIEFSKLSEMLSFYQDVMNEENSSGVGGDFIFFSNKVFNMRYVKKYLKEVFVYSYTTIPQNMPILFGLDNEDLKLRISNKKIVSYSPPDGDHWNWLDNGLGMTILADLPLHITENEKSILYRLCMLNYLSVIQAASTEDEKTAYEKRKCSTVYINIFFQKSRKKNI